MRPRVEGLKVFSCFGSYDPQHSQWGLGIFEDFPAGNLLILLVLMNQSEAQGGESYLLKYVFYRAKKLFFIRPPELCEQGRGFVLHFLFGAPGLDHQRDRVL